MNARENNRRDRVVALALALAATVAAALALSSPAEAATYGNGFKLSKFKVEVKGWQTMVQQFTHASENECDPAIYSSGSEKLAFRTTKPIVVTASYMKGLENPTFLAGRRLSIPVKATLKRSYTPRVSMPGPAENCGDNGGGVETTSQPDCGTRPAKKFSVGLEYSDRRRGALVLIGSDGADPFERCPGNHLGFPSLLTETKGGAPVFAELTQDELFDPRFRKWISIATGSRKEQDPDYWTKATIRWEVSFTRLKEKVGGR